MRWRGIRYLPIFGILAMCGCSELGHLSGPTPPTNLNAVFTEDIFGTDGIRLTWEDTNGSADIGFTVYRDGQVLADIEPDCLYVSEGELECTPPYMAYFDIDVARGETHCYTLTSHYYDATDDLIFGESGKAPEACITIPLQGFS